MDTSCTSPIFHTSFTSPTSHNPQTPHIDTPHHRHARLRRRLTPMFSKQQDPRPGEKPRRHITLLPSLPRIPIPHPHLKIPEPTQALPDQSARSCFDTGHNSAKSTAPTVTTEAGFLPMSTAPLSSTIASASHSSKPSLTSSTSAARGSATQRNRSASFPESLGIKFGVNASISESYWAWKNTLNTFTAVSNDSLIFAFCKTGDIGGVQTLLSRVKASVRDTNTQGWTPLHVSE